MVLVCTSLFLAGCTGLVRSGARLAAGILPAAYLPHGIALTAAISAGAGLAAILFALASSRFRLGGGDAVPRVSALVLGYLTFWVVTTSGFAALLTFNASSLMSDLPAWGPGAIAYVAAGLWLSRGPRPAAVGRLKVAALALVFVTIGATLWSHPRRQTQDLRAGGPATSRPPVILVLVDTLRPDHLSVYGYDKPTSPAVDRLAKDGVTFTRAFAQAPWTRPSCGALFTARLPPEVGLRGIHDSLSASARTIPQFLKSEAYATAGIVSSVHVSAAYGFERGFDDLDIGPSYVMWTGVSKALRRLRLLQDRDREGLYPRYDARELTDRAIRWLNRRDPERPFFLYLHYADPHQPYRPAEDRWREFAGAARSLEQPPAAPPPQGTPLPPDQHAALLARYDAEIAYFDRQFERVIATLKALGLYDSSMIILTADHGEEFFEHGGWGHAHTLYNELLRIPLILKLPSSRSEPRGVTDRRLASSMDVLPTVKHVLGANWNAEWSAPSLLAPIANDRLVVAYRHIDHPHQRTIYTADQKLIETLGPSGQVVRQERYCLGTDPEEKDGDGRGCGPGTIEWSQLETRLADADRRGVPSDKVNIDTDTAEELRALGYIR